MRVHIDARSRDYCHLLDKADAERIIEVPDNVAEFFDMVREHGRFSLIEPGSKAYGAHPTLWTLYFENDYD